jgi:hypothetical protein
MVTPKLVRPAEGAASISVEFKIGKLDADLAYSETTGVTVSIWSDDWSEDTTENITGVLPPPWMTANTTITSGSWVRIVKRPDGVWYVDSAACQ